MLELIYDSRETKIKELLEETPLFKIKCEYLDLGDFIFKKDNKTILIIERKTMSDLYSSIRDGRYKEQKIRLFNNFERNQIVYIIEGELNYTQNKYCKNNKKILSGAILNMVFRDNLKVLKTKSIEDTKDTLYHLGKKINDHPEFFYVKEDKNNLEDKNLGDNIKEDTNYLDSIKISKKENMTPQLCNIIQLSQIPGVSKKMAKTILSYYKSICALIIAYQTIPEENERKKMLKDIVYLKRKIGPVLSERIYTYLFL